jgi:hypothetical protein
VRGGNGICRITEAVGLEGVSWCPGAARESEGQSRWVVHYMSLLFTVYCQNMDAMCSRKRQKSVECCQIKCSVS